MLVVVLLFVWLALCSSCLVQRPDAGVRAKHGKGVIAFLKKHGILDGDGNVIPSQMRRVGNLDEAPNASQDAEVKNKKRAGSKGATTQVAADEHGGEDNAAMVSPNFLPAQYASLCPRSL